MENNAPEQGYILPEWNLTNQYRATAIAYMKREKIYNVDNVNGNRYPLIEVERSTIGNDFESSLRRRLTEINEDGVWIRLSLIPPIWSTMIEKESVNTCTVAAYGKEEEFNNISESFYDEMVRRFDSRDKETTE